MQRKAVLIPAQEVTAPPIMMLNYKELLTKQCISCAILPEQKVPMCGD